MIDRFIDNERKSRIWTTVNIGIFCLLGLAVFWLAFELNQSNAKYKTQNVELKKTKDDLAEALKRLDAYNESLKEDSTTLSNNIGNYDSLKKVLDTVLILFKESESKLNDMSVTAVNNRLDQYSQNVFKGNVQLSENIKNKIVAPVKPGTVAPAPYKIYVQYMPGYDKIASTAAKTLRQNSYTIPGQEQIKNVTFNPVVKYFYDKDKGEAEKVAALVNKSNDYFSKNPVKIQKMNLKSPSGQLEVWIGDYREKNVDQIIQQQQQIRVPTKGYTSKG